MGKFYEKNALITGATGAIGTAIADVLSKKFNLVLIARNEKNLKKYRQLSVHQLNILSVTYQTLRILKL